MNLHCHQDEKDFLGHQLLQIYWNPTLGSSPLSHGSKNHPHFHLSHCYLYIFPGRCDMQLTWGVMLTSLVHSHCKHHSSPLAATCLVGCMEAPGADGRLWASSNQWAALWKGDGPWVSGSSETNQKGPSDRSSKAPRKQKQWWKSYCGLKGTHQHIIRSGKTSKASFPVLKYGNSNFFSLKLKTH